MASKESFEKLYERALAASTQRGHADILPVLEWKPSRSDRNTLISRGHEYSASAWRGGWVVTHNWSGQIVEQDELTDSSILKAQRAAEEALRKYEATKAVPTKVDRALTRLNEALVKLTTNKYTKSIPVHDMVKVAKECGFYASEDNVPIITTYDGRDMIPVGYPGSRREIALSFTWHRMESGNYEVVAYAN